VGRSSNARAVRRSVSAWRYAGWLAGAGGAFLDEVLGVADVAVRAVAQSVDPARWAVLFARDIRARLLQELERTGQPIAPGRAIDRLVIVQILAVIDRGFLDLVDRGVDLADRALFVPFDDHVRGPGEEGSRGAQIGQRVEIGRMLSGRGRGWWRWWRWWRLCANGRRASGHRAASHQASDK